jgi:hypothetical protein
MVARLLHLAPNIRAAEMVDTLLRRTVASTTAEEALDTTTTIRSHGGQHVRGHGRAKRRGGHDRAMDPASLRTLGRRETEKGR